MKFKTPKSADLMTVAKGFGAFEVGKRVGRGIVGAIPSKDESQDQLIKGGVAVAALVAAAAYQGKNKDLVVPACVGLAAEQVGDIVDAQAKKMITPNAAPGMPEKFLYDTMGLGCPGHQNQLGTPVNYPMLLSPSIQNIEWDEIYTGSEAVEDYAGV